jgi:hypothetical protein
MAQHSSKRDKDMPAHMHDVKDAEEQIWDELLVRNAILQSGIKLVQLLCQPVDVWKERGSLMISFEEKEDYKRVIQDGIFVFGELWRTPPY